MPGRRRTVLAVEADVANREQLAKLGVAVRAARARRHLTREQLGAKVGLGRMAISRAERGLGAGLTLDAWQRIATALDAPLKVELQRDPRQEPQDAGHLGLQELVLGLGRRNGFAREVELPTKPAEPWRSIDVALVDDRRRLIYVIECWNVIGDIGAGVRSSTRKLAEAEALAAARWGERSHRVGLVWVLRATRRNRELVARYPEVFATRFPGSSTQWVRALSEGAEPPADSGVVWASVDGKRIFPWRRR